MLAKDAEAEIVRNPNPLVLPSYTTVVDAARHMESHHVSAVLVTEGDAEIVGIFTGRDAVARVLARGRDPIITPLSEVMTYNPVGITPPPQCDGGAAPDAGGTLPSPADRR